MSAFVFALTALVLLGVFFLAVEFFGPRGPGDGAVGAAMQGARYRYQNRPGSPVPPAQRWRGESRGYVHA